MILNNKPVHAQSYFLPKSISFQQKHNHAPDCQHLEQCRMSKGNTVWFVGLTQHSKNIFFCFFCLLMQLQKQYQHIWWQMLTSGGKKRLFSFRLYRSSTLMSQKVVLTVSPKWGEKREEESRKLNAMFWKLDSKVWIELDSPMRMVMAPDFQTIFRNQHNR